MPMKENIFYWEHSLEHPEPEVDKEPHVHDKIMLRCFKVVRVWSEKAGLPPHAEGGRIAVRPYAPVVSVRHLSSPRA